MQGEKPRPQRQLGRGVFIQSFGVTVEDVGLDEADLARWRQGYERAPDQAVELFADKHALDRVSKPSAGFGR